VYLVEVDQGLAPSPVLQSAPFSGNNRRVIPILSRTYKTRVFIKRQCDLGLVRHAGSFQNDFGTKIWDRFLLAHTFVVLFMLWRATLIDKRFGLRRSIFGLAMTCFVKMSGVCALPLKQTDQTAAASSAANPNLPMIFIRVYLLFDRLIIVLSAGD
jgi:hypothetical protein